MENEDLPAGAEDLGPVEAPPAVDLGSLELPAGAEELESVEDLTEQKAAKVRAIFRLSAEDDVDREASVQRLSRRTGMDADVARANYDEIHKSWIDSLMNPREWMEKNPGLANLVLERPELGRVVVRDEKLSDLRKLLRMKDAADELVDAQEGRYGFFESIKRQFTGEAVMEALENLPDKTKKVEAAGKPKQVKGLEDQRAQIGRSLSGLDRLLVPIAAYEDAKAGEELSHVGHEMLWADLFGQDTSELRSRAELLKIKSLPRDYGTDSKLEQAAVDSAQLLGSQLEVWKGMGVGGALGAVGGGLVTRSTKGALGGAKLLGGAGAALATFRLEAGSSYVELLDMKTDDGRAIDREARIGAAMIYGGLASAIELGTLGPQLARFGPIGDMLKAGNKRAFFKAVLKDRRFLTLAKDIAKRQLKGTGSEMLEEGLQSLTNDASDYFAKSYSAGTFQKETVSLDKALAEAEVVLSGSLLTGAGGAAVNVATQLNARANAERAGQTVEFLAGLKESPTVVAAPEVVADLVADETAKSGEKVTHLYVDPEAFVTYFQGDASELSPNEAATELLGEQGEEKLREALLSGGKVEIDLSTYLEKFGGTDAAQALAKDTTTRPNRLTLNQLQEALKVEAEERKATAERDTAEIEKLTQENVERLSKEAEVSAFEKQVLDQVEEQLVATGKSSRKEAAHQVAVWRALASTMAERFGRTPDELFRIIVDVRAQSGEVPAAALRQPGVLDETPEASRLLSDQLTDPNVPLSAESRAAELYLDAVTGLRSRRGFDETARPAGKLVAVITTPDIKAINDDPAGGHDTANELLRVMGSVIGAVDPEAARSGTNFLVHVDDQAQLDELLQQLQQEMPDQSLRVEGAAAATVNEAFTAIDTQIDEKRKSKALPARGETAFDLAKLPKLTFKEGRATSKVPAELVKKAGQLTPEEYFRTAYQDELVPGILSGTAWRAIPRKAFVAALDLRGLKAINDTYGKPLGTRILQLFGEIARDVDGSDFDFAHLSGDEYAAQANSEAELRAFLADLRAELQDVGIDVVLPDGTRETLHAQFRGEVAAGSYGAADRALNAAKRKEAQDPRGPGESAGGRAEADRGPGGVVQGQAGAADRRGRKRRRAPAQAFRDSQGRRRLEASDPKDPKKPRGYVEFTAGPDQRKFRITLTDKADLSTFLHESGHVFLELLGDLASRPDAPEQVKADYQTALKWMGVERREDVKTEHHEKFARGFEAYLLEGKTPSTALARAFQRFRTWLLAVYRTVKPEELSPEIRGVFDRMLAVEDELPRVQVEMGAGSHFASAAEMGVTAEEFAAHVDARIQATSHGVRAAELRALREQKREAEQWWKEELKAELAAAQKAYEELPARQAHRYLLGDDPLIGERIILDRKAVEEAVGPELAKKFLVAKEGGVHPDVVAELFDFATGKPMLEAILALPDKRTWTHQVVDERMREKHGDLLQERERLRAEVAKGLHGDYNARVMLAELNALRRKAGLKGDAPVDLIRQKVKEAVARRTVRQLDPSRVLRDERKAAMDALKASARGRFEQAAAFETKRLFNALLFKALSDAKDETEKALETLRGYTDDKRRAKIGKAGATYLEQIDTLLEAVELRQSVSMKAVDRRAGTVAWLEREAAEGRHPVIPESVLRHLEKTTHWKNLKVDEVLELRDAIENIAHLAKLKTTLLERGERRDFVAAKAELLAALGNLPDIPRHLVEKNAPRKAKARRWARKFEAAQLRPEEIIRRLDRRADGTNDVNGPWHRYFWNVISDADYRQRELFTEVVKPIAQQMDRLSDAAKKRLRETSFEVKGQRVTLEQALVVALNWGNESNRQKMMRGFSMLHEQGLQDWDLADAELLLSKLELQDWELVKRIAEQLEAKWPDVVEMHKRLTGLPPGKVKPSPFKREFADGTVIELDGWYYPVIYDPAFAGAGKRGDEQRSVAQFQLFDRGYYDVITPQGHLETRNEDYSRPVALTLDLLPRKLNEAMKDLAMREALLSAHSVIIDKDIQNALTLKLGEEGVKVLEGALRDSANDLVIPDAGAGWVVSLANKARSGTTGAVFAFNIAQTLQNLTGVINVVDQVPPRFLSKGIWRFLHDRGDAVAAVNAKSAEMRTRADHFDRDVGERLRKLFEKQGLVGRTLDRITEFGLAFFSSTDRFVATMAWTGAYEHAVAPAERGGLGLTDELAARHADKVVRTSLASGRTIDLPAFMRAKNLKLITMFMGWSNGELNRIFASISDARGHWRGGDRRRALRRLIKTWLIIGTANAMANLVVGRGPDAGDDDELDVGDVGKWAAVQYTVGPLSKVAYVSGLVKNVAAGRDASLTPWIRGFEDAVKATMHGLDAIAPAAVGEDVDEEKLSRAALEAMSAAAYFRGLPVAQTRATATYLTDKVGEDLDEGNYGDVVLGVTLGKARKRK